MQILLALVAYFILRYLIFGFFTIGANERAVKTSFGRAQRLGDATTLDDPIAQYLDPEERERYSYPQVKVIGPGLHFKMPWERVHRTSSAIETISMAFDPETPDANKRGTVLDAVTKDQLNTGLTGQIRYRVSEKNLYAFLFGVRSPFVHIMGYFVSVLRELIANFESEPVAAEANPAEGVKYAEFGVVSINDLRKNLRDINDRMFKECLCTPARYGITLDASLITGINPPHEVESALAAINTAHNHVSSEISLAQAGADQKIVQSRRAVEIETLKAQAEMQPFVALAEQLTKLKNEGALQTYLRSVRLGLFNRAARIFREVK